VNNLYIKFTSPSTLSQKTKETFWQKLIRKTLSLFIPIANPDFESKIDAVSDWLIEFENGNEYPNREIGLNTSGKPIMVMPWKKNYGYWIDNNLLLKDFKSKFDAIDIAEEEFEKYWTLFEKETLQVQQL
jgi:hypothetical protein